MISFDDTFKQIKESTHTIHAIVSPLASNDLANVLLSLNQAPFLAEYYKEVYEVTQNSHALLINLGTLNQSKLMGIKEGLKSAKENKIPIILDPVGASATKIRLETSLYYLKNYPIKILKGNYSEIYSIYHKKLSTRGVDAKSIEKNQMIKICQDLSTMYNTIVVATGKEDIISDGKETLLLKNGSPLLPKVTGTGCMLGGLIACAYSFDQSINAIALAISILNIGAELAIKDKGMATFKISLLDQISLIASKTIEERIIYEKLWPKSIPSYK